MGHSVMPCATLFTRNDLGDDIESIRKGIVAEIFLIYIVYLALSIFGVVKEYNIHDNDKYNGT
jgi:hypothetical protein